MTILEDYDDWYWYSEEEWPEPEDEYREDDCAD